MNNGVFRGKYTRFCKSQLWSAAKTRRHRLQFRYPAARRQLRCRLTRTSCSLSTILQVPSQSTGCPGADCSLKKHDAGQHLTDIERAAAREDSGRRRPLRPRTPDGTRARRQPAVTRRSRSSPPPTSRAAHPARTPRTISFISTDDSQRRPAAAHRFARPDGRCVTQPRRKLGAQPASASSRIGRRMDEGERPAPGLEVPVRAGMLPRALLEPPAMACCDRRD